jgi:DNA-binding FadR family transcriptional regulator
LAAEQNQRTGQALRIHQALARELGIAILTGKYAPGDSFGGEIERSEELGISRTAYREAIRILAAKGLIESRPKAGTHVTPRKRWNMLDPDMLAWMLAVRPDDEFVNDLLELRFIIEPAAAYLAAERRSEAQLASMQGALETMRVRTLATEEGRAADRQFHGCLIESAGNQAMASLASSIGAAVEWTTHLKEIENIPKRDPIPEHKAVLDAIAAQDGDAAATAMRQLIRNASEDLAPVVPPRRLV